jgi:hypothetical protein
MTSSSSSSGVPAFFSLLDEFLDDIKESFPSEVVKLETYRKIINTLRKVNGRLFIKKFMDVLKPFEKEILDCNEKHFLELDPVNLGVDEKEMELISIVKDIWRTPSTSDTTKASIWAYLQGLLQRGDEIVNGKKQKFKGF